MDRRPLLSVCIPTFNRASLLRECLESVVGQAVLSQPAVEVVVSDNCSTDATRETVAVFQRSFNFVRYYRNPQNLGGRRNIWIASTYAVGCYVWLLGDDDLLLPGAMSAVLDAAAGADPLLKLIFLNDIRLHRGRITVPPNAEFRNRTFERGIDVLMDFPLPALAHISRLVVRRDDWLRSSYESHETSWGCPQLSGLLDLLAAGRARFLGRPAVLSRTSDSSWFAKAGPMIWCFEYPWVYEKAAKLGYPRYAGRRNVRRHWLKIVRQVIKMEVFADYYRPSLHPLKRVHGTEWYYHALIVPIHGLLQLPWLRRWVRKLVQALLPRVHVPAGRPSDEV